MTWQTMMQLAPVGKAVSTPMLLPDYQVWQAQRAQCERCEHVGYGDLSGMRCTARAAPRHVQPCIEMRDPGAACGPGALLFKVCETVLEAA